MTITVSRPTRLLLSNVRPVQKKRARKKNVSLCFELSSEDQAASTTSALYTVPPSLAHHLGEYADRSILNRLASPSLHTTIESPEIDTQTGPGALKNFRDTKHESHGRPSRSWSCIRSHKGHGACMTSTKPSALYDSKSKVNLSEDSTSVLTYLARIHGYFFVLSGPHD